MPSRAAGKTEQKSKLQRVIDSVITVIFIAVIFFMGVMTVAGDWQGFHDGFAARARLANYLKDPENYTQWEFLIARIKSLDNYLASNCYGHTELGYVNSGIQYALGKRMVVTGASQMVRLNTGHLYDLQNYVPMDGAAENILSMREMAGDTPFLFVYENPTLYSGEMMPDGYDVLDYGPEIADEITSKLREAGVELLDSREYLPATGMELTEYLMYTDQHWSTRAAIATAQVITEKLEEMTGAGLDASRLDIENFDVTKYDKLFLGKYGQRIGTGNIDPDDIYTYAPKYETHIHRFTNYLGNESEAEGSFPEAVLKAGYLEPDAGKTWNIKAYFDYGLTENYEIFDNEDGAPCTILLLKDSYSAPVGGFLSLVAQRVVSVDLRRSDRTLDEWIEIAQPDMIVTSYSMQMLRDDNYEFQ